MNLLQDLRFACRLLLKDPWFTLVAATALALGIGVNTTVFSLVNAVLIRGLPFDGASEIVYLATRNTTGDDGDNGTPASWREFQEWRTRARSFEGIAGFIQGQMNISDPDHPAERVSGASVSANTFRLLRQQPVMGRDFADGEDAPGAAPVVIIGHQIWKNRFASDPDVLGRPLKIARGDLHDHRRHARAHALPDQRGPVAAAPSAGAGGAPHHPERGRLRAARARRQLGAGRARDGRHLAGAAHRVPADQHRTSTRGS